MKADQLNIKVFPTRSEMGKAAAKDAAEGLGKLLSQREEIYVMFAAAPSQNDFLEALTEQDVPWNRVNALHMDEYVGLPSDAPQAFGTWLKERIFSRLPFKSVHYISDYGVRGYADLLAECPPDAVFCGIGENGHIAFNDPHVALFDDPEIVKVVDLDLVCRTQQVHDGCFPDLDSVPLHAATVTIPVMMEAPLIICVVPCISKAAAVKAAVNGPVTTACPASILRLHPNATLYCDKDSASLL